MKAKWILQTNIFKEKCVQKMIDCFKRQNIPYQCIKIIPFSDELPEIDPYDGPIVAYGTTTLMINMDRDRRWFPGMWYDNKTFRPSVWGNKLKHLWLNRENLFVNLEHFETIKRYFKEHGFVFMRPDSDLKLFDGAVFDFYEFKLWYDRLEVNIESGTYKNLSKETVVLLSPKHEILHEWRYVIVDKQIAAWSMYKSQGMLFKSSDPAHKSSAVDYMVNHIAKKDWQLAPAYVVDICETSNNDIHMIELNTFNASGFYDCDIMNIIHHASQLAEKQWDNNPIFK